MNYVTVEVELDHGKVRALGLGQLPDRARALLTVLETNPAALSPNPISAEAGLRRLLSAPDFALTPEQFRSSMEADFFEQ
jgi:hypothetical protein